MEWSGFEIAGGAVAADAALGVGDFQREQLHFAVF